nr:MAG TPA: hypothetical protein [Caudoviricetes sp.]
MQTPSVNSERQVAERLGGAWPSAQASARL